MFRGGQPNPYDDIVSKATDENQTSENWEVILNLCDKVLDEGEQGARNVMAAVLKRLVHRNPNVQLYTLALVEALSKNCGIEIHREIASRSFTQGLEKLITDRTAHEKVKRKALGLIAMWASEFENDPSLGIMEECYTSLKAKNYKFDQAPEPPPPAVDDDIRRREEEELQRVLEMSMLDKGGRQGWAGYAAGSSSAAAASSSTSNLAYSPPAPTISTKPAAAAPLSPMTINSPTMSSASPPPGSAMPTSPQATVTRVRALHSFEPTEPGELAFEKGDIIKVVDRNYKDWWRGQLRGRTGIFPVNYVEPVPEPTAAEIAREAEHEASVFSQAANIDKLLGMLRTFDPAKDNLADNEEIQELYRTSMSIRPKIVKLIDKYSQKRADLVLMNESFVKARTIFDRMMEDSLARHTGLYNGGGPPGPHQGAGPYGWNPAVYEQGGYPGYGQPQQPGAYADPSKPTQYPPQPYGDPQYPGAQSGYGATPPVHPAQSPYPSHDPAAAYAAQAHGHISPQPQPQQAAQPGPADPQAYAQYAAQQPNAAQPAYGAPAQQLPQHQQQQIPQQQQPQQQQPQQDPQAQQQHATQPQQAPQQAGPAQPQPMLPNAEGKYVFDPNGQYGDGNVQAWAQYYAQGGTDLSGSVYFVSIPGLTDQAPADPHAQLQPLDTTQVSVTGPSPEPTPSTMHGGGQFASMHSPIGGELPSYGHPPAETSAPQPQDASFIPPQGQAQPQSSLPQYQGHANAPGYGGPPAGSEGGYGQPAAGAGQAGYVQQMRAQLAGLNLQDPGAQPHHAAAAPSLV